MADTETVPLLTEVPSQSRKKQIFSSFVQILACITVEPAVLLQSLGHAADRTYQQSFIVAKVCQVHFSYNKTTCDDLESGLYPTEQDNVQRMTSDYNTYIHWAEYGPAMIISILLGSYGDFRGRRLPVFLPFFGCALSALCYLVNAYIWSLPTFFIIITSMSLGLTGGIVSVSNNSAIYLSVVTSRRSRTFMLSSLEWLKYGTVPLGIYMATLAYNWSGYMAVFGLQLVLYLSAVIYLLIRLKDPKEEDDRREMGMNSSSVKDVLSPSKLVRPFTVSWRHREQGSSRIIIVNTLIVLLNVAIASASPYNFLYTRKKFGWQTEQYADWLMFDYPVKALGVLVVTPVVSWRLGLHDGLLGFLGGVSSLYFNVILGTAPYSWVVYVASLTGVLVLVVRTAAWAILSKHVRSGELGAVFSLLGVMECCVLLAIPPLLTLIYNATLDTFPGAIFLIMASCCITICWLNTTLVTWRGVADVDNTTIARAQQPTSDSKYTLP